MKKAFRILEWLFSGIFLLATLGLFKEQPLGAFFMGVAATLLFPPLRAWARGAIIESSAKSQKTTRKREKTVAKDRSEPLFLPTDEFVYLVSNNSFERGIFKIGMTKNSAQERINQINSATGVPEPFRIDVLIATSNARRLEATLHTEFSSKRLSNNREFFKLEQTDVVWIVNSHRTVYTNFNHLAEKHGFSINPN